jgi:hypothetical protein
MMPRKSREPAAMQRNKLPVLLGNGLPGDDTCHISTGVALTMIKETLTTSFLRYAKPIGCSSAAEDYGAWGRLPGTGESSQS